MAQADSHISDVLLKRLQLWSERLIKITHEMDRYRCELADLGHIAIEPSMGPEPGDHPQTVRLKESLMARERDRRTIIKQMSVLKAEILNEQTLEILLPGGPEPDSFLSWLPGEPHIGWWREKRDLGSPRRPLPGVDQRLIEPTLH